jgi:hypothetical protein
MDKNTKKGIAGTPARQTVSLTGGIQTYVSYLTMRHTLGHKSDRRHIHSFFLSQLRKTAAFLAVTTTD